MLDINTTLMKLLLVTIVASGKIIQTYEMFENTEVVITIRNGWRTYTTKGQTTIYTAIHRKLDRATRIDEGQTIQKGKQRSRATRIPPKSVGGNSVDQLVTQVVLLLNGMHQRKTDSLSLLYWHQEIGWCLTCHSATRKHLNK